MMNIEEKFEEFSNIALSQSEKDLMRNNLTASIDSYPVRKVSLFRHIWRTGFSSNSFSQKYSMPVFIAVLFIALSGGTAFASENTLPGDTLYPVKVNVNERFASAVKLGESDANWKLRLAERRLEEAAKLSVEGKLSADVVAKLEDRFTKHQEKMQSVIDRLESKGRHNAAARLASNLEVSMQTHADILERLQARAASETDVTVELLETVREKVDQATAENVRFEAELKKTGQINSQAAAGIKQATENKLSEVERFISSVESKVSAEAIANARLKLASATELMVQADTAVETGAFSEAFALYRQAHRAAQESKMSLVAEKNVGLKIEAKQNQRKDDRRPSQSEPEAVIESDSSVDVNSSKGLDVRAKIQLGN